MAHSKQHATVHLIHEAAVHGASELAHHGMPHAASAVRIIGDATAAIGKHVRGWHHEANAMIRGAPIGSSSHANPRMLSVRALATLPSEASGHRKRRKSGKRRKLTRKQIAAGFGGKRRKSSTRKPHRTKGKRRHLTPAQKAAGFGGKRAMHHKRRRKGGHKRRRR